MIKKNSYTFIVLIFCALMMLSSYFISRGKKQINETKRLPFYNTPIEKVANGIYDGKTYTSFLRLQVQVTVENQMLKEITFTENKGSKGFYLEEMAQRMIDQNKVVVSLNEKDKLGSLVLISCVDDALSKGLTEQVAVEE